MTGGRRRNYANCRRVDASLTRGVLSRLLAAHSRRRHSGRLAGINERLFVYRIIGSDEKEYGPVSAEQIRQWLREGRLNRTSRLKPEGATEWKALGAFPEFDDLFPPLPGMPPKVSGPAQNCGMATASLVCGALGLVTCVTAPVGLVFGLVAHSKIRQSNGQLTGSGLATGGIVLSSVAMLLWLLVIPAAMLLPALSKAKGRAQSISCMNNVRQLTLAVMIYANDNKGVLPPATNWCDAIQPNVGSPRTFQCLSGDQSQRSQYGLNARLAGLGDTNFVNPATLVLVFEIDGGWNATGGPELLPKSSRHGKGVVIGFADGHAELVSPGRLQQLKWEP